MIEEVIEFFDSHGKLLGARPRSEVHTLGLWHRGVHAFLFNSSGLLLVQRRSESCDSFPNTYDCSVSEHLAVKETFEEAVLRGCREELGVNLRESKKLVSYKMKYGPNDNMICDLFTASIDEHEIKINKSEVASIEYLSIDELLVRLERDPSQFTSWFKEQLLWFAGKTHLLLII